MTAPLAREEFEHLLEAYAFEDISDSDLQRLAEAVLESADRALEFAHVQELRDQLSDSGFRRELLEVLEQPAPSPWWRRLTRPQLLVPLAASLLVLAALPFLVRRVALLNIVAAGLAVVAWRTFRRTAPAGAPEVSAPRAPAEASRLPNEPTETSSTSNESGIAEGAADKPEAPARRQVPPGRPKGL